MIDYKARGPLLEKLLAAPGGIDVCSTLSAVSIATPRRRAPIRTHARFAICAMIDLYNLAEPTALRHFARLIGMRIRMTGLLVTDDVGRAGDFYRDMGTWLGHMAGAGQGDRRGDRGRGLDAMPDAFLGLVTGENRGETLVRLQPSKL